MFLKNFEISLTTRIFAVHPLAMTNAQTIETEAIDTTAMHGKVVIITGAARGQGAREAELFASVGAGVVATDVRDELGQKLAASLGEHGAYLHHDVTNAVLFLASPTAKYITGAELAIDGGVSA